MEPFKQIHNSVIIIKRNIATLGRLIKSASSTPSPESRTRVTLACSTWPGLYEILLSVNFGAQRSVRRMLCECRFLVVATTVLARFAEALIFLAHTHSRTRTHARKIYFPHNNKYHKLCMNVEHWVWMNQTEQFAYKKCKYIFWCETKLPPPPLSHCGTHRRHHTQEKCNWIVCLNEVAPNSSKIERDHFNPGRLFQFYRDAFLLYCMLVKFL